MKPQAIDALTSLRFFAAAAVVIFHMQGTILQTGSTPALALGVSFFFVLSGFILTYAYQGKMRLRSFYLSRFARLWPTHIVTMLLAFWLIYPFLTERPEWTIPAIANALLLHAWVPVAGWVFGFNGVAWSISAEFFFYLAFPLARRWLIPAIGIAVTATASGLAVMEIWDFPIGSVPIWNFSASHFLLQHPVMRILEFMVGMAAGKLFLAHRIKSNTAWESLSLFVVFGAALMLSPLFAALSSIGLRHTAVWVSQAGGMAAFAAAIYVFAHQQGSISRALQWRPLVLLGEVSFCTYMIHQIVFKVASSAGWGAEMAVPALVIVYPASFALWSIVEVPGRRLVLNLARPRPKVTASA
jgi:peptidoglycan/LPS O-acetylase OafA/YrhL